ncbi:hypothetical protein UlMin_021851 [Ulmus minor]
MLKGHGRSHSQLGDLLLVASLTKTLSESGTRYLPDPHSIPLSELLLLQIPLDFFRWCSLRQNYKHSARTYSHMFRTLCREEGVFVDSGTFKALLDAFLRSGKFDSALEILDVMEELGISLNTQMYNSVLVALVRKNQMGLAFSIFFKLLEDSSHVPSSIACNESLVALRKADMRVEFKLVFDKLREKRGFGFDIWGYNICIHAFGCCGDLGTSLKLFKEMKDSIGPDLCTYNSLLHVLCFFGKVKDALVVWEELKGLGHEPDAFPYRTLVQGCCKTYRIDDAAKIFSEMQHNGYSPDTVVYNSLIDGLFKARKIDDACQVFEKMTQDGVRASSWTYNILIDGLFRNGMAQAGYTLFCDFKKKGQFVDGISYSIVVLQLCREGLLEEALALVEEMEGRGFVFYLVTIIWDSTDRLVKHIRDGNLVPNVLRWKVDMEALVKNLQTKRKGCTPLFPSSSEFSEIMNLIGSAAQSTMDPELVSDDAKFKDDDSLSSETNQWSTSPYMDHLADQGQAIEHFSHLFTLSRGQRGKLSLACKLFEIFHDMGVNPISYTYNSLMTSFVKKGYFDEAWGILNEMGEKVCPADIATYNVIIQGLGNMGRADLASAVLDKLIEQGGYLDVVMYNTLINALGKAGRIGEVNKLLEQMRGSGTNPNIVTYNTLQVHTKSGRLNEAYKFLKMMLDAGCIPNHISDTTLDFLGKEIEKQRYQKASMMRN